MSQFIQVPYKVLRDHKLHPNSKHLLGLIISLNKMEKGCTASNIYFAEILGVDVRTIKRYLVELKTGKYIEVKHIQRLIKKSGLIRIMVATNKGMVTPMKTAEKNIKNHEYAKYIKKGYLPDDIEKPDWWDEYIQNIKSGISTTIDIKPLTAKEKKAERESKRKIEEEIKEEYENKKRE